MCVSFNTVAKVICFFLFANISDQFIQNKETWIMFQCG